MNDITKNVKLLEYLRVLYDGVTETAKYEVKK